MLFIQEDIMSRIKNIIFDLDGTLADSLTGLKQSILFAIRAQGHDISEEVDIKSLIGPPMNEIFKVLLQPYGDDRINEAIALYRENYQQYGLLKTQLFSGIFSCLSELQQQGFALYIATSKRQRFAETILTNTGIAHFFTAVQGSSENGQLDDKSLLVAHLLQHQNMIAAESVFVGDRADDVIAAKANQLAIAGVQWGYAEPGELAQAGIDIDCHEPHEIVTWVNQLTA